MILQNCTMSGFADEINKELETQIQVLQKLGQKYVEFRSANGKGVAEYSLEEMKKVKETLNAAGIKVSALGSPIGKIKITDDFAPHFETYKHVVELAKILDTKYIRMFSFFIPEGEDADSYETEVFRRMKMMVDYAKEQNVVLLHENEKEIYGDIASRCKKLMDAFYGDNFKCTFDFANFIQCKQETMEAYELLKPYITYIHVKDAVWANGEVVPPGQGDGKLYDIFTKLDAEGYHGFLSMEPHLVNFDQLNKLESNAAKRNMSDGSTAYELAFTKLRELLAK